MLQTHVNNDIYNKFCLIHNKIQLFSSLVLKELICELRQESAELNRCLHKYLLILTDVTRNV